MPTGIRGGSSPHDSFFAPYSATIFTGKFHCDLVRGIAPQPTPHLAKDVEIVVISELAPGDCPHHHITIWAHGFRVWGQSTACRFRIHDGECPQTSIVHQCPQIVNANPFLPLSPLRAAAPSEPHHFIFYESQNMQRLVQAETYQPKLLSLFLRNSELNRLLKKTPFRNTAASARRSA